MRSNTLVSNSFFLVFCVLITLLSLTYLINEGGVDVFSFQLPITPNYYLLGIEALSILFLLLFIKNGAPTAIFSLVAVWTLWVFLVALIVGEGDFIIKYNRVINVLFWPSCFFLGYMLITQSYDERKIILFFALLNLVMLMACYKLGVAKTQADSSDIQGYTSSLNYIFYPLLTLPWILRSKKRMICDGILIINVLGVLLSAKRSALICCILIAVLYIFNYYILDKQMSKGRRFVALVVFLVIGSAMVWTYLRSTDNYVLTRFENMREDKGSGRTEIYANVVSLQQKSSVEYWIAGHGHNMVLEDNVIQGEATSAHNDFLEVLYDYGLIGILLYLSLHILLIKRLIYLKRQRSELFFPFLVSYILFVVLSSVSHLILYASYFGFLAIFWGAMEAKVLMNSKNDTIND